MRAVRVHAHGGPEVNRWEEVPDPVAGPGEVLVRVRAIGVNFSDVYHRRGLYPAKSMPFIPGQEGAGEVIALGSGTCGASPGDLVAWAGPPAAYAELASVPADRLVRLPAGLEPRQAAAAMLQGMTAHYLATSTYPLKGGDACLIHAAAGGVGLLLVQIAKLQGARVIATVSTEEKARLAREAGADEVLLYGGEPFDDPVRRWSGGGVQAVYDGVGKDTFEASLRCLAPRGTLALFGQSSGPVGPLDPQVLNARGSVFLTRPSLSHYTATRAELEARAGQVLSWVQDGRLRLRIGAEFPLREAAQAQTALEGRRTTGKVLLVP